ncbi:hypothetical protein B0A69_12275 [Chryseobacterium shigense]|uniref:Uncharacterized protein n=1 Tax=Chryseobacterium shigense TaxID=297244 RepID=A0A1N7JRM1_9FLAO|nr:hypothetical protein [Chryseobacterium shigense]PQA92942.1 hypothetical protein B0A69_12275 [Chryseobacterium shigense]SIS51980.1 hypothetical protein SAMN05421639_107123 [Chryseobacterium shigense]
MGLSIEELRRHALFDPTFGRLEIIIEGLNKAITYFRGNELAIDWWGSLDDKKEYESMYKLAILAIEDYLKLTIKGFFDIHEEKDYVTFYESEPHIDLIFLLADYIKSNSKASKESFSKFDLSIDNYPIYHGVVLLNKDQDLNEILKNLKEYRAKLIDLKYPE